MTTIKLPEYKGYTIDVRLKQCRKVSYRQGEPRIEFVEFASEKGIGLLKQVEREDARLAHFISSNGVSRWQ